MSKKSDTQQILELLKDHISYTEVQFAAIADQFVLIDKRFESINLQLKDLKLEQTKIGYRLDGVQTSIDRLEQRKEDRINADELEDRIADLEYDMTQVKKSIYS